MFKNLHYVRTYVPGSTNMGDPRLTGLGMAEDGLLRILARKSGTYSTVRVGG
jgi:hypothetical protein